MTPLWVDVSGQPEAFHVTLQFVDDVWVDVIAPNREIAKAALAGALATLSEREAA